jgi:uncharacterized protein
MKQNDIYIKYEIKKRILDIDPKAEIILYGSRARDKNTEDSDWDLLILIDDKFSLKKEKEFRDYLYDLELEMNIDLSVFVYNKNDWESRRNISSFYMNVNTDGIEL